MANDLKQRKTSQREDTRQKIMLVEQAGNRILVSAAGAAAIGGAFAGLEGALVGAIAGFFPRASQPHQASSTRLRATQLSGYVLAGVIVGLLLSAVHIWASVRAGQPPKFETAAQLVLSGVGVGTGLKVLKICVTADTLRPFPDGDRVYILLGGLALIWLSVSTVVNNPRSDEIHLEPL